MITCPKCGAELPAEAIFCGNCGKTLQTNAPIPSKNDEIKINSISILKNVTQRFKNLNVPHFIAWITSIFLVFAALIFALFHHYSFNNFIKHNPVLEISVKNDYGATKKLYFAIDNKKNTASLVDNKNDATSGVFYKGINSSFSSDKDSMTITETMNNNSLVINISDINSNFNNTYSGTAKISGSIPGIADNSSFNDSLQKIQIKKIN